MSGPNLQKLIDLALMLPRQIKLCIVLTVDVCLSVLACWFAFYLRVEEWLTVQEELFWPVFFSLLVGLPIFYLSGLYREIFRHSGLAAITIITRSMALYCLIYMTLIMVVGIDGVPRTVGLIQPLLLFLGISSSRLLARWVFGDVWRSATVFVGAVPRVLIYGAGSAGQQLAMSLSSRRVMDVYGFIDDNARLAGHSINGIHIFSVNALSRLIENKSISYVLLAMPSIGRSRRNEILQEVGRHRVVVRTLPSVREIAEGRVTIHDLQDLDIDDLLGRESINPDDNLLREKVSSRRILVTGAGGSIGSELCRQIIALQPENLILIESSEFALYRINGELESIKEKAPKKLDVNIVPLLCSVHDRRRLKNILDIWKPDTIFHAAAYKHVPIVEANIAEGLRNNVFGTLVIASEAIDANVKDLVLISTDKAVRPTNVMGASKRIAEMILQALNDHLRPKTILSMVRFGNVLESSGSVIPKFRNQIHNGGPVTLTHPKITRFFMTIPEASQLVIQAGALASGGDLFVLDMGQPVEIKTLAEKMITLSGLTVKDLNNPDGDIEILISGLRPGEKLHEEIFIGDDIESTVHPKIMRARENFLRWDELEPLLNELENSIIENDIHLLLEILEFLVDGFEAQKHTSDLLDLYSAST